MADNNNGDLTRRFLNKWESPDPTMKKQAEYAVNSYVRMKVRENGIARSQILPPIALQDGQLDKDQDPTVLKKFMEIEPDSEATWVPFRGMPQAKLIKGKFVPVYFGKITSTEHVVHIIELKNFNNDLRKILNEIDVKEIQKQEDSCLLDQATAIVLANPAQQDIHLVGGFNKVNWTMAQQAFFPERPIKFALMNVRTHKEFQKWDMVNDMGFGSSGHDTFLNGAPTKVNGIQIISTLKTDLVPDGVVWFWSKEDFIGKFFTLMEPTTFIEQRGEWLSFYTYEYIGIGIANTKSFIRATFLP